MVRSFAGFNTAVTAVIRRPHPVARRWAGTLGCPGRGHQCVEETPVAALLGVPLDPDDEPMTGQLDGLDDPVPAPRRGDQSGTERSDRLMMTAEDIEALAEHRADLTAFCSRDRHLAESAGTGLVDDRSEEIGQVLDEVATESDVQELHPATDREHR